MENKELIQILWDYMQMNHELHKADCMIVLGSVDTSVADHAAKLYLEGYAEKIIFTGGLGKITSKLWNESEAQKFANIAISRGVPKEKIYMETESTNTGDNFKFTKKLIEDKKLDIKSVIIVCKPCNERRAWAVFRKVMPEYEGIIASNKITMEEYNEFYKKIFSPCDEWINVLVGDVQRMKIFAEKGWQIPVEIPDNIWNAYEELVNLGYDKYVVR